MYYLLNVSAIVSFFVYSIRSLKIFLSINIFHSLLFVLRIQIVVFTLRESILIFHALFVHLKADTVNWFTHFFHIVTLTLSNFYLFSIDLICPTTLLSVEFLLIIVHSLCEACVQVTILFVFVTNFLT